MLKLPNSTFFSPTGVRLWAQTVSLASVICCSTALADFAVLVDAGVLVEQDPTVTAVPEGGTESITVTVVGTATDASYVSGGGFAVVGTEFIDVATMSFDFSATTSVSQAILTLPIDGVYDQNGAAGVEIQFFADNGVIEVTDYTIGFTAPIITVDAMGLSEIRVDVTGAVNSILKSSRFAGFRVHSTVDSGSVDPDSYPAWTGVQFSEAYTLEFTSGAAPPVNDTTVNFDGHTLEVPNIVVPVIGTVAAQLKLVDPNQLLYQLTAATVTNPGNTPPPLSGADLFDCDAFAPPPAGGVGGGDSTYAVNAGILDIPSVNFNDEQLAIRLEYIEGSDPWLFETLSLSAVQSGPSEAVISDLSGGLIVEPTQDFVSLCHGWILIGDSIRNRVVERNILSGETGAVYNFNSVPDQFTLDDVNERVYITAHPPSERLYRLDLDTGVVSWDRVTQTLTELGLSHTYGWALVDITLGEDGNVFALMLDKVRFDPENGVPYTDTGLWMGIMDPDANFLADATPLLEPVRIEYDAIQDHVFLANQTNLATFDFDPATNLFTFVEGTDVQVGESCTDFSTSPDGNHLAYSCPKGNSNEDPPDYSIWDMDPEAYFNIGGEWYVEAPPVSAMFNAAGTLLFATDNIKLYVFDVVSHLILETYELGLLEGESVRKMRLSHDGDLIYFYLNNDFHAEGSKFYWMPTPNIIGTPLP